MDSSNKFISIDWYKRDLNPNTLSVKDEDRIITYHPIIESADINNQTLASLYARNYDGRDNILDKLDSHKMNSELISTLSKVGLFCSVEDRRVTVNSEFPYDGMVYKAQLDTGEVLILNLTVLQDEYYPSMISFANDLDTDQMTLIDITDTIDLSEYKLDYSSKYNRYLIMVSNTSVLSKVNVGIHNVSSNPHKYTNDIIIRVRDEGDLYNKSELITDDFIDIQSDTKIGEGLGNYKDNGDSSYLQVIWDPISNAYISIINFESYIL